MTGSSSPYTPSGLHPEILAAAHSDFLTAQQYQAVYNLAGMHLLASPGVYHPAPGSSTEFMLRHLPVFVGLDVLDVGTGSGAIGIHCGKAGNRISMSDIDPDAYDCALFNSVLNGVNAHVFIADVFDTPSRHFAKYDAITFNLPFYQKAIVRPNEHIACDPGGQVLSRFLSDLCRRLKPGGAAFMTYSNLADPKLLSDLCAQHCLVIRLLASEVDGATGVQRYLYRLTPRYDVSPDPTKSAGENPSFLKALGRAAADHASSLAAKLSRLPFAPSGSPETWRK